MNCPYCDREMTIGNLIGDGRSGVHFQPQGVKFTLGDILSGVGKVEAAQFKWFKFQIPAYHCSRCRKMIIDTAISK